MWIQSVFLNRMCINLTKSDVIDISISFLDNCVNFQKIFSVYLIYAIERFIECRYQSEILPVH